MPGALIYWAMAAVLAVIAATLAWIHIGPGLALLVALAVVMLGARFAVVA